MTSLGPMASLAANLPARGRTARAFLVLVLIFVAIVGGAALVGTPTAGPGLLLLRISMAVVAFMMFALLVLLQWRRLVDFKTKTLSPPDRIPSLWRLFLMPYRRADVERMATEGRLAELMTLSMLIIIAAGLLIAVVVPKAGHAEEIRMAQLKLQTHLTPADVERDYLKQVYPSPVSAFAFSLMIPRGWLWFEQDGRAAHPDGTLQLLGRYGERSQKSIIEVYALQIEREIAGEDWLDEWMAQNHYVILARRSIPSVAGRNADVWASRLVEGQTYLYRLRTYKNGKFIYLLNGFSEEARYPAVEDSFLVAAASFKLSSSPEQSYAESLRDVPLDPVLHASFKIPESWTARADKSVDPNCQSWGLSNGPEDARVGVMNVYAAPLATYASAPQIAQKLAQSFHTLGAEFDDKPLQQIPMDEAGLSFFVRESDASVNGHAAVVRQTIIASPKGWVAFTMLSATPKPDLHLLAATNRRGYDIAITSFLTSLTPK